MISLSLRPGWGRGVLFLPWFHFPCIINTRPVANWENIKAGKKDSSTSLARPPHSGEPTALPTSRLALQTCLLPASSCCDPKFCESKTPIWCWLGIEHIVGALLCLLWWMKSECLYSGVITQFPPFCTRIPSLSTPSPSPHPSPPLPSLPSFLC